MPGEILLSSSEVSFVALEVGENPADKYLTISNSTGCGSILDWGISEDCEWLSAIPLNGSLGSNESEVAHLGLAGDAGGEDEGDFGDGLARGDEADGDLELGLETFTDEVESVDGFGAVGPVAGGEVAGR